MTNTNQINTKDKMNKLLEVVSDLRDPINGCPWDLNQTHLSLVPYVLEEAYEVAHAIREDNPDEFEEKWTGDYVFENEWQSFRTKDNRKLELVSSPKEISGKSKIKIAVKVIDIFGNDTMKVLEVNI